MVSASDVEKLILTRMLAIIAEMDEDDDRESYIKEVKQIIEDIGDENDEANDKIQKEIDAISEEISKDGKFSPFCLKV